MAALELPRGTRQVFLNYFSFVSVLCQMSRALPEHFPGAGDIPGYQRIKFYRNKVIEHWDDYVAHLGQQSFVFREGNAPIPAVEGAVALDERAALLAELKCRFTSLGVTLGWDDQNVYNMVSINPEYSDAVFTALEAVPGGLTRQSGRNMDLDGAITLMLRFGFPTPIRDIEEYGKELCDFLQELI